MEGFILAAGLGTRLRPLTDRRPKALVEIPFATPDGATKPETLLEHTIHRLERCGVSHIVVNVHHFADMVIDFIASRHWQARIDISDERDLLLDTGGGLKKAASLFSGNDNILIHNVDILSDIDLADVERRHRTLSNLATLCVSHRSTKRLLAFSPDGLLLSRTSPDNANENSPLNTSHLTLNTPPKSPLNTSHFPLSTSHFPLPTSHSPLPTPLAFSGVSVVSPALFDLLPPPDHPYPIIDEYIRLSAAGQRIAAYIHPADRWLDVGKPETLNQAAQWKLS